MWTTMIACEACEGTHLISAASIPRGFEYDCPTKGQRVVLHFRDPARMPDPWVETAQVNPEAVPALQAELHGRLDI